MRKTGLLLVLLLSLALSACQGAGKGAKEAERDIREDLADAAGEAKESLQSWRSSAGFDGEKAHQWRIYDGEGTLLYTVAGETEVAKIDELLSDDGGEWLQEDDPGQGAYTYAYWQEKTLLAGQDSQEEREYEELVRFTVAESSDTVTLQIMAGAENLNLFGVNVGDLLTFRETVSQETAEALRNPDALAG